MKSLGWNFTDCISRRSFTHTPLLATIYWPPSAEKYVRTYLSTKNGNNNLSIESGYVKLCMSSDWGYQKNLLPLGFLERLPHIICL